MSVIKFRLFSSVLPAACAVRDAPQANAATAEVERKFLRVIFMVVCLLYIWVYFTQTVGGCQPLRAFILRKNHFDLLCYRIHRKCMKVNDFCIFDIKNVNVDKNVRCKLAKTPLK